MSQASHVSVTTSVNIHDTVHAMMQGNILSNSMIINNVNIINKEETYMMMMITMMITMMVKTDILHK